MAYTDRITVWTEGTIRLTLTEKLYGLRAHSRVHTYRIAVWTEGTQ